MTCVGHSLGAHICGMVSTHLTTRQHRIIGEPKTLLNLTSAAIKIYLTTTIFILNIGLDPARPIIEYHASQSYRLTRDDADYVQIIHTNAGTLGQVSFTGTLDLCINGGKIQPFCKGDPIRKARCSHFLSVCYLANAIFKHKLFPFTPCPKGCVKSPVLPFLKGLHGYGGDDYGAGSMMSMMHIGQDVPKE